VQELAGLTDGNMSILVVLLAPVLLMITGVTIDFCRVAGQKTMFQAAVVSASLAAANEPGFTDSKREDTAATVQAVVENCLKSNTSETIAVPYAVTANFIVKTGSPLQVEVVLTQTVPSSFGSRFGLGDTNIVVNAVTTIVGKPNIGLIALEPSENGAIDLNHQAKVVGQNCSIFSNSTHNVGINSKNDAQLTASTICSAGGGKYFTLAPWRRRSPLFPVRLLFSIPTIRQRMCRYLTASEGPECRLS
jgi:hypothetical protein